MKLFQYKKENSFKLKAMSDTRLCFGWCQLLDFLIFADTTHSILCLLIFIWFYCITKFYCDGSKGKVCRRYSEKNIKLSKNFKKLSRLKMLLVIQRNSLLGRKMKKLITHLKLYITEWVFVYTRKSQPCFANVVDTNAWD